MFFVISFYKKSSGISPLPCFSPFDLRRNARSVEAKRNKESNRHYCHNYAKNNSCSFHHSFGGTLFVLRIISFCVI